jgi:hypothetical protein
MKSLRDGVRLLTSEEGKTEFCYELSNKEIEDKKGPGLNFIKYDKGSYKKTQNGADHDFCITIAFTYNGTPDQLAQDIVTQNIKAAESTIKLWSDLAEKFNLNPSTLGKKESVIEAKTKGIEVNSSK